MFAAVNSNTIQVFKTYSCETVCNLRGHNNKVLAVAMDKECELVVSGSEVTMHACAHLMGRHGMHVLHAT